MEFAKAAVEPDFEDVEVEFPIESPPSKRPKLDDPDTTTISTESTDVKESHKAEEKPIYVLDYPDFDAGVEIMMAGYSDLPSCIRCPICNKSGHINVTCRTNVVF